MKYLTVVECPVAFPAENEHGLSSKDMLPRAGVTGGLESRHVRVLENRITAVCIWASQAQAERFFDRDWHDKADAIWGAEYQTRFETIDSVSAA
ncbi:MULTISPECIES: hypothetical protein [Methylobacterium]|uniref:ABM domain-containing protein n=1 Tax=Methylobacterium thuringiense TaxID=1003091 RepID=A0ABQ4TKJ7_9HYPH|nr:MULTISPECIES: hypothetical protein [Methylobacterium]TXN24991.1 hypothetical protein FV217_00105 [Methylobacterium sp. WL9]GJE54799.1 hypothetical protein EKPJFOCH_1283 [Methylobacterium thuringiense]